MSCCHLPPAGVKKMFVSKVIVVECIHCWLVGVTQLHNIVVYLLRTNLKPGSFLNRLDGF